MSEGNPMGTNPSRTAVRGDAALALMGLVVTEGHPATGRIAVEGDTSRGNLEVSGRRVAAARTKSRMTGAQLGAQVGLGRDQISKIERGQRRLAPREVPAFAAALGVTVRYLLGAEETPRVSRALRLGQRVGADAADGSSEVPATQRRALELLNVEEVLASQLDLPQPRLSAPGAQVRHFAYTELRWRPRNKAEAQRQGRRLAEEVRAALDLGSAEIRDLAAVIETHFAADVALSPLGNDVDGLCAHTVERALLVASSDFPDGHVRFTLAHELGHHLLGDPREVITEDTGDMYADDILERRVNSFSAHLLMPEEGVREALAWLNVAPDEIRAGSLTAQHALGVLMRRFGVSLQALLFQLADLRVIGFDDAMKLKAELRVGAVTDHVSRAAGIPNLFAPPTDAIEGTVRPPQRLLDSALAAARAGTVGIGTVAVLLERPDDDDLFDAVRGDAQGTDLAPILFTDEG